MIEIKEGSRWSSITKVFIVLHVVEKDGHVWVHYRDEKGDPPMEYSCYQESFLSRFRVLPE